MGRRVWRRAAVACSAGAVVLGLVSPLPKAWADNEQPLTAGQEALAQAASTGDRVEVTSERSEYSTVFANPDGDTFTLEQAVAPGSGGEVGRRLGGSGRDAGAAL